MAALLKKRALAEFSNQNSRGDIEDDMYGKRLKLGKRIWQPGSSSGSAFIGLLSTCKSSNEALQLLLRVSETTSIQEHDIPDCVRKLLDHLAIEKESVVRAKIMSLLGELGSQPNVDSVSIIEELVEWLKKEESHKVIEQGLATLLQLGKMNSSHHFKLVQVSKEFLKDTGHIVKCRCLDIIAAMLPISEPSNSDDTLRIVANFSHCEDARVRGSAFTTLVTLSERGQRLGVSFYHQACAAFNDDYEMVRLAALKLIALLAKNYGEETLIIRDENVRLTDDAFSKVCHMVTDLSISVRTLATTILGDMKHVSNRLLQQTLYKSLMSNMRLKLSSHERSRANLTSGEWATGAKWMEDSPRQLLNAESVSLIASGSCGALVHGLEDEFQEVRIAAVDTLCNLSLEHPDFAVLSLDFLVDMFNDEIEHVRLRAIESLTLISKHIILREDQLETILGVLKDFSLEVREGLHRVLSSCRVSTTDCLQMTVESLLENLKKYPQDRRSAWRCAQAVGARHPDLTLPLVPELLAIHPFFDTPEPDVEDPLYITVLILIFNAAKNSPTMSALFEEHTLKHYRYLRDTMPNFVPNLKLAGSEGDIEEFRDEDSSPSLFIVGMMHELGNAPTIRVQLELMEAAQRDLLRISEGDSNVGGAPVFLSLYIRCQLLIQKIIHDKFSPLATYEPNTIYKLHQMAMQLQYSFTNLTDVQVAAMLQLKLKVLSLRLVKVVKGNGSALYLCQHFLEAVESTQRYLIGNGIPPEPWVRSLFRQLFALEDNKSGVVARALMGLIKLIQPMPPPPCHVFSIGMCKAIMNEPCNDAESVLKFTAGLVAAVQLDAEITDLPNPALLRVKVKYPDQNCVLILPRKSSLRRLENPNDYRLLTTVLLSHQVWTESCYVEVSLVLELSAEEGVSNTLKLAASIGIDPYVIDLCKPVKVYVSPKAIKRGV